MSVCSICLFASSFVHALQLAILSNIYTQIGTASAMKWLNCETHPHLNQHPCMTFLDSTLREGGFSTALLISLEKLIGSSQTFYCSLDKNVFDKFWNSFASGSWLRTQHIRATVLIVPLTSVVFWIYHIGLLFDCIIFDLGLNFG